MHLHNLPIHEVSELIRSRAITCEALTRAILTRIACVDPILRSYTAVAEASALAEAQILDAELARGVWRGPLHGVPLAYKDLFDVAGIEAAAGTVFRKGYVPPDDADAVARLRKAGAITLGKLAMTEAAFLAYHPSHSPPINPWNERNSPGASSSGPAVATAAGLCFGALGSDTGGSIRLPAALNELTGLKPSWGLVSPAGSLPLAPSLDHVGPITRDARDAALLLSVIAGRPSEERKNSSASVPDYAAALGAGVRGLRIGVLADLSNVAHANLRALEEAKAIFADAGALIVETSAPVAFDVSAKALLTIVVPQLASVHAPTYRARPDAFGPVLARHIEAGLATPPSEAKDIERQARALADAIKAYMAQFDLLLTPVMEESKVPLNVIGQQYEFHRRIRFMAPFSVSGLPALVLPAGLDEDGAPLSLQIAANPFDDGLLLAAGHCYQSMTNWHRLRPPEPQTAPAE